MGPSTTDCLQCAENRVMDSFSTCTCPANTTDYIAMHGTAYCGTCDTIILKSVKFSSDFTKILIDLGLAIEILDYPETSVTNSSFNLNSY